MDFGQEIYTPDTGVKKLERMRDAYTSLADKEKYFRTIQVDTIEAFDALMESCLRSTHLAFRGVKDSKYRLQTSGQLAYKLLCEKKGGTPNKEGFQEFIRTTLAQIKSSKKIEDIFVSQNLPINDFLYFALLQHYEYPSPLLDFTYDVRSALFFMLDGISKDIDTSDKDNINNYCSLYIYDCDDPELISIQEVNTMGGMQMNDVAVDAKSLGKTVELSDQAKNDFLYIPYETFKDFSYFGVHGHAFGRFKAEIPSFGFKAEYDIDNPRIDAQAGLFVFVGDAFKSLEESIVERSHRNHITAININKKLADQIQEKYLSGVKRTDIYPKDKISRRILCAMRKIPKMYCMAYYKTGLCWISYWCSRIKDAWKTFTSKPLCKIFKS